MRHHQLVLLVVLFSAWGCKSEADSDSCERGTESCECLSSGGCDKGLTCLSNVCVDEDSRPSDRDEGDGGTSSGSPSQSRPSKDGPSGTSKPTAGGGDASTASSPTGGDDDPSTVTDDSDAPASDDGASDDATSDDGANDPTTTDDTPAIDDPAPGDPDPIDDPPPTDDATDDQPDPGADPPPDETPAEPSTPDTPAPQTPSASQQELTDGSLGSSCGQCDDYWECDSSAPGGYCTAACFGTEDCPGGECYTVGGGTACLLSCQSDADCRPGYSCGGLSASPVCVPGESMPVGCSNACVHFLTCQGSYTEEGVQACTQACDGAGFTTAQVEEYLALGCSEAVSSVSGDSSASSGGGSDCKGCVWDGSSCTYYSDQYGSSSTGYSWAAISCNSSCCQ